MDSLRYLEPRDLTLKMMRHLVLVNVIIIVLDVAMLCTQYADLCVIQTTFKSMLYALKLKFEFAVLNNLVKLSVAAESHSTSNQKWERHVISDQGTL